MKQKFIDYYMDIAERTAKLSYAKRLQVGSVIVKEHKILATGYNGMPTGWENVCEYEEEILVSDLEKGTRIEKTGLLKTKPEVLHSEMNSLMKVSKSTESSEGSTLFCTHSPCLDCAKAIYQAGIKVIYYKNSYRSEDGLNFLRTCGVDVHKHSISI
jgi:dCMP deaminase